MTDTNDDTTPDTTPPPESTLDGYEPEVEGETQPQRRARKARNRRRAEKVVKDSAGPAPVGRPRNVSKRATSVTGIVTTVGVVVMVVEPTDGRIIVEGAADLGNALAALADKNPRVAKALDALTESSAWVEVGVALGAIVVPIVRNHLPTPTEQVSTPAPPESNSRSNSEPAPDEAAAVVEVDGIPTFRATHNDPEAAPPVLTFEAQRS